MPSRQALIIGNSEYQDPRLARLTTPAEDVGDLADVLRAVEVGGFDEVTTLVNQSAPVIRRAVARLFADKKPDDLLLLYFSGHGVRDDRGLLYLAVQDTEHDLLNATAIPAAFVTEEMDRSRSRRQVLILDCCHSGAFAQGAKGVTGASVGTRQAFEGAGYGRVVLTATDATQFAWEGDQLIGDAENSVFTRYLVEGLRTGQADTDGDGQVTLDELYDYVYAQVMSQTPRQTPRKFTFNQQGEIVIATNPRPVTTAAELPAELRQAVESPLSGVRQAAVGELERMLTGSHRGLALAARDALQRLAQDDSRRVSGAATASLAAYDQAQQALAAAEAQKAEANRQAAEQRAAEQKAAQQAAAQRRAAAEKEAAEQRVEAERRAAAEQVTAEEQAAADLRAAEQRAAEQAAAEQLAAAERLDLEREAGEREAAEKAAAEQKAAQEAAEQRAAEKQAAERAAADQRLAEQRALEQRAAEQRLAEQRAAELKAAEKKAAEQKLAEQKLAEQKASEQRAAERRAAEQKAAEEQAAQRRELERRYAAGLEAERRAAELLASPPNSEGEAGLSTQPSLHRSPAASAPAQSPAGRAKSTTARAQKAFSAESTQFIVAYVLALAFGLGLAFLAGGKAYELVKNISGVEVPWPIPDVLGDVVGSAVSGVIVGLLLRLARPAVGWAWVTMLMAGWAIGSLFGWGVWLFVSTYYSSGTAQWLGPAASGFVKALVILLALNASRAGLAPLPQFLIVLGWALALALLAYVHALGWVTSNFWAGVLFGIIGGVPTFWPLRPAVAAR